MPRVFIIEQQLFVSGKIAQRIKQNMAFDDFDVTVRRARMIDELRAVAAHRSVNRPIRINRANLYASQIFEPPFDLAARDAFADVFGNLAALLERLCSEAALTVYL